MCIIVKLYSTVYAIYTHIRVHTYVSSKTLIFEWLKVVITTTRTRPPSHIMHTFIGNIKVVKSSSRFCMHLQIIKNAIMRHHRSSRAFHIKNAEYWLIRRYGYMCMSVRVCVLTVVVRKYMTS